MVISTNYYLLEIHKAAHDEGAEIKKPDAKKVFIGISIVITKAG